MSVARSGTPRSTPSPAPSGAVPSTVACGFWGCIRAVQTDRIITLMKARAEADGRDPETWAEGLSNLPLGRAIQPREVADLVAFLASPRASYLSGMMVPMDGGLTHRASAF